MDALFVGFGEGRILISRCISDSGVRGLLLKDTGEPHTVGDYAGDEDEENHKPQPDEIYLQFRNLESAIVLREMLDEVIKEWPRNPAGSMVS